MVRMSRWEWVYTNWCRDGAKKYWLSDTPPPAPTTAKHRREIPSGETPGKATKENKGARLVSPTPYCTILTSVKQLITERSGAERVFLDAGGQI